MNPRPQPMRNMFLILWSVLMTALTYVLGAAPLRVMRIKLGRVGYWAAGLAISAGFYAGGLKLMAISYLSLVVLMGVFDELEEVGLSFMVSGFFTLLINCLLGAGAFAMWVSVTGANWSQKLLSFLELTLKPITDMNPHFPINFSEIMLQLPSVVVMLWMGALYLAVLQERRLSGLPARPSGSPDMRSQIAEFRVPDVVVWIFIGSLLGAFGGFVGHNLEAGSINIMNVCVMLFFFQGIAVVSRFFETMRMDRMWQFVLMVIIVLYLFLFVSLLGLTDHWLDFRLRLAKRAEQFNREV